MMQHAEPLKLFHYKPLVSWHVYCASSHSLWRCRLRRWLQQLSVSYKSIQDDVGQPGPDAVGVRNCFQSTLIQLKLTWETACTNCPWG